MVVAESLKADLDVIVCRKFSLPMVLEGGIGAVSDDGTSVLNEDLVKKNGISQEQIEYEISQVKANVKQRALKYKGTNPPSRLSGKTAIIVDDGLASGITMTVAVETVKHKLPREIVVAVPVSSATGFKRVSRVARVFTCAVAEMPKYYLADFYRVWRDITDDETAHLLEQWRRRHTI
jgi:putative phosphoribosyl transferase